MTELKIKYAELQEVLQGYLDPTQKKFQQELGDVPIGENGITRRLWQVNYLSSYFTAISRFGRHRFAQNFAPTIQHELWTAQTTWTVEVLRLLDEKEFKVKGRPNLTISLYHGRLQNSVEVTQDQKAKEDSLYLALTDYQKLHNLKNFRNRQMFHLDLEECLLATDQTGNMEDLNCLIIEWYSFSAGIVMGGEPNFVTRGAPIRAKEAAKTIIRMMLDSIRFQCQSGRQRRALNRYGPMSNQWRTDLFEKGEEKEGFALLEKLIEELRKEGQEIKYKVTTDRLNGRPQKIPQFDFIDAATESEFIRRFNTAMEEAWHCWHLRI